MFGSVTLIAEEFSQVRMSWTHGSIWVNFFSWNSRIKEEAEKLEAVALTMEKDEESVGQKVLPFQKRVLFSLKFNIIAD